MTLSLNTISSIQNMTIQGLSQRAMAAIIGHTLATVNKYSKMLRYYTQDALRLSQYYCRCLLAQNAHLTLEEFETFVKQELKLHLKKKQFKAIFKEEVTRLYIKHLDLFYNPGEAAQFDWGTIQLTIGGAKKRVCLAVFSFPYSNYRFFYPTTSMTNEGFLEAFQAFIHHIGAIPPVLNIDNMRIAVQYDNGKRILTSLFRQLEQHYGMKIKPCTPHQPQQKGNVENAVRTIKTHLDIIQTYTSDKHLANHIKQFNKAGDIITTYCKDGKKRKRHYRIWHMLNKIKAKAPGFINSHEYKQLPKHLRLLHDKLCSKHTHFFIEILKSFEHEPAKKLKRFIYTLLEEKVTYEQLKKHLKLE